MNPAVSVVWLPPVPVFVPVTVTGEFPMNVEVLYAEVSVSVAVPVVLIEEGERLVTVTPFGNPLIDNATFPVNP